MLLRILLALGIAAQIALAAATCESLSSLSISQTKVTLAQSVAAGRFALPAGTPPTFPAAPGPNFKDLPAFCRVSATSMPSSDSEIKIEVWMPVSGWNGKLRGTGNGGLGGNLGFGGLATAMHGGFAAAAENTGYENGSSYALSHPEKTIDFGDRAAHEMTIAAKAAIATFYGSAPKFSYMDECGGGEGTDHFDLFPALQQWVEQKQAPWDLVASRIENGKEVRTRPLCAYPEIASYKGSGSTDDAANFTCKKP